MRKYITHKKAIVVLKSIEHFARYLRGIFAHEEKSDEDSF
jgi:hypothetical protein